MSTNMTAGAGRPSDRTEFQIGIITALDLETESVVRLFDKSFDTQGYTYGKHALDDNSYSTGQISGKPVVLCQLASMGKLEASTTAQDMRLSFDNIRLLLLVGIAAGNPWISDGQPILLGDVVLSTRVIEMDYGRLYPSGIELRRGVDHELTKSDRRVRNFLIRLREPSKKLWLASKVDEHTSLDAFPGPDFDILYDSNYTHKHRIQSCNVCQNSDNQDDETCDLANVSSCQELQCSTSNSVNNAQRALTRQSIDPTSPVRKCRVHFGTVASGSSVIKSARHRDQFSKSTPGIVAYEMEGAGIWEKFPTIVVKGICDYADTHKDKRWQPFAAARAAACAKILIAEWIVSETVPTVKTNRLLNEHWIPPSSRVPIQHFIGYSEVLERLRLRLLDSSYQQQIVFVLSGMGGIGKTEIVLQFLQSLRVRELYWAVFWIDCTTDVSVKDSFDHIGKAFGLKNGSIQDVKHQISSGSRLTLLILDNCDNPAINYSNKYVPFASHVRVILTGRTQECERYATFDIQQARDYQYMNGLSTQSAIELIIALSKDHRSQSTEHTAAKLSKMLGNHPLAIRVACSFIRRYAFTMSEYITRFEKSWSQDNWKFSEQSLARSQLLETTTIEAQHGSIFNTFNVSARRLLSDEDHGIVSMDNDAGVYALELLDFAACVNRTNISLDLFVRAWRFRESVNQRVADPLTLGLTDAHVRLCDQFGRPPLSLVKPLPCFNPCIWWSQTRSRKDDIDKLARLKTPQYQKQSTWGDPSRPSRMDKWRRSLQSGMARLCEAELATFEERGQAITLHPLVHEWTKLRLDKMNSKDRALAISGSILALAVGDAVDWHPSSTYLRRHMEAYLSNDNWRVWSTADHLKESWKKRHLYSTRNMDNEDYGDEKKEVWNNIDKCRAHIALAYPLLHMQSTKLTEDLRKLVDTLEAPSQRIESRLLYIRAKQLLYESLPKGDPDKIEMQKTIFASLSVETNDMAHDLIVAQRDFAVIVLNEGKTREAIHYLENLERNYLVGDWDYDRDLLALQELLGVAYRMNGELDRAKDILQRVVQKREEFEEEDDQLVCSSRTYLADVYNDESDFASASDLMNKTLEVMLSSRAKDDHFLLLSQQTAAKAYFGSGYQKRGIKMMREVQETRDSVYGSDLPDSIEAKECLEIMSLEEDLQNDDLYDSSKYSLLPTWGVNVGE